MNELA